MSLRGDPGPADCKQRRMSDEHSQILSPVTEDVKRRSDMKAKLQRSDTGPGPWESCPKSHNESMSDINETIVKSLITVQP